MDTESYDLNLPSVSVKHGTEGTGRMPQRRLDTSSWGWRDAGTSIIYATTCFLPWAFNDSTRHVCTPEGF